MGDLSYHHGAKATESADTPSVLRIQNFGASIINGVAPDADAAAFPINRPQIITSLSQATLLRAAGTLLEDVKTYFAEGGSLLLVNRVAHSLTPSVQQANLLGDLTQRTGVFAALKAKAQVGVKPRVLVTAGDTGSYIEDGITSVALTNGGSGFTSPPAVTFTGGTPAQTASATATINKHKVGSITVGAAGSGYTTAPTVAIAAPDQAGGVQATATATVSGGAITGYTVTDQGSGYSTPPAVTLTPTNGGTGGAATAVLVGPVTAIAVTNPGADFQSTPAVGFTGGGGTGALAVAHVGDVANAFISAFAVVTEMLNARAYVEGPNTTDAEAVRFRNTINSGRIMVIDPKTLKNVNGVPVVKPVAPVFAGVRARVVGSSEGVSGSVSNKIIRSIDGVARTIEYPTQSNYLNERSVSTIINERGGFRTWGSRLATDNQIWIFDSVRATADMINESLEDLYFLWVDRKMTRINLKQMVEDGNAALRTFALNQDIIGGSCKLSDQNTPDLNVQGNVFLDVEFEPIGIMEQIRLTMRRNILRYRLLFEQARGVVEETPLTFAV